MDKKCNFSCISQGVTRLFDVEGMEERVTRLEKDVRELKDMLGVLWYRVGGPGYEEAEINFKEMEGCLNGSEKSRKVKKVIERGVKNVMKGEE